MIKILFLAANPQEMQRLQLDEEVRAIREVLRKAKYRDQFELKTEWAVRVTDLQQLLLDHQPHVVHFSGHGSATGELILQDETGQNVAVPPMALTQLFQTLKDNIRCIVLNACYSVGQAEAIAQHIDCIVSMSDEITDEAARHYATAFYRGLANGRTLKEAHDLGAGQLALTGLAHENKPQLLGTADPTKLQLVDPAGIDGGIEKIKKDYLHLVAKGFSSLIPDEPDRTEINLIDVFMMPNAYATLWESVKTDSAPYEQLNQKSNARNEIAREGFNRHQSELKPKETALPELMRSHQHLMILGEPGSGKSTAIEFICLCYCQPDKKMVEKYLGLYESYIPIFITLSEANLTGRLEDQLIEHLINKNIPDEVAPEWLKSERFVVLLDGLDEIPIEKRQKFLESVYTFIDSSPGQNCRLIITSRIGAYREIRLPSKPISLCTLSPLNDWDTAPRFVEKWLAGIRKATPREAKHEADELLKTIDSRSDLKKIKNSPLLLQLVVAVYVHSGELVSNRSDLYKLYIRDVLLKRAKRRNKQQVKIPLLFEGLCVIACLIQFQGTNTETKLAEALEYVSGIDDGIAFLDFLRNDLGILTSFSEPYDRKYSFFHSTFREYFIARWLKYKWEHNEEEVWEFLKSRLHHSDWIDVLLLLVDQMNDQQVCALINRILKAKSQYENILHRDIFLVATIISESNQIERSLCETVASRMLALFGGYALPSREGRFTKLIKEIEKFKTIWLNLEGYLKYSLDVSPLPDVSQYGLFRERVDEGLIAIGKHCPHLIVPVLQEILYADVIEDEDSYHNIDKTFYYEGVYFSQRDRAATILVKVDRVDILVDATNNPSARASAFDALDKMEIKSTDDLKLIMQLTSNSIMVPNN